MEDVEVDWAGSYLLSVTCLAMESLTEGGCEPVEIEDGHHWVFRDSLGSVWDPWELGMQVSGGHQLCSVHCLMMEMFPEYRKKTSPQKAYRFVTSKLPGVLRAWFRKAGGRVRREARRVLRDMHPGKELPRGFFAEDNIVKVLRSDRARVNVPKWK